MEDFGGIVFVLIFIAISVMDGIGRKRKAKQKGAPGKAPGPKPKRPVLSPPEGDESRSPATVSQRTEPAASPKKEDEGSQELIPKEIWDEILGLARGAPPGPREVEPEAQPVAQSVEEDSSSWAKGSAPGARRLERPEADTGRRPGRRDRVPAGRGAGEGLPARRDPSPVPASTTRESVPAKALAGPSGSRSAEKAGKARNIRRDLVEAGSSEELKRAIILREVLGPPLGSREWGK